MQGIKGENKPNQVFHISPIGRPARVNVRASSRGVVITIGATCVRCVAPVTPSSTWIVTVKRTLDRCNTDRKISKTFNLR